MQDIYTRVSVLALEHIEDKTTRDNFLNKFAILLNDYSITPMTTELTVYDNYDLEVVNMYLGVKAVEGLATRSMHAYAQSLSQLRNMLGGKSILKATTNDIRCVLAKGITQFKWGIHHANRNRNIWGNFYKWAHQENYIEKSPMLPIKKIKGEINIRQPFSETEMEKLRNGATTLRDRAIIEFLLSTACRVSEVAELKLCDLDLKERKAKVLGKGRKERIVFINERAALYLQQYLDSRKDDTPNVFVSLFSPYNPLKNAGIEIMVRELGKSIGVPKVHPHRFRHTAATFALRRGMPIEQVQKMLGHNHVDTTLIYAKTDSEELQHNHKKYLS